MQPGRAALAGIQSQVRACKEPSWGLMRVTNHPIIVEVPLVADVRAMFMLMILAQD
jgi:hypothetical protein